MDIYRRIALIRTEAEADDLLDELIDRYGDPPQAILGLIKVSLLRNSAAALGITEITQRGQRLLFYIQEPTMEQTTALSQRFRGRVVYSCTGERYYIAIDLGKGQKSAALMQDVIFTMRDAG